MAEQLLDKDMTFYSFSDFDTIYKYYLHISGSTFNKVRTRYLASRLPKKNIPINYDLKYLEWCFKCEVPSCPVIIDMSALAHQELHFKRLELRHNHELQAKLDQTDLEKINLVRSLISRLNALWLSNEYSIEKIKENASTLLNLQDQNQNGEIHEDPILEESFMLEPGCIIETSAAEINETETFHEEAIAMESRLHSIPSKSVELFQKEKSNRNRDTASETIDDKYSLHGPGVNGKANTSNTEISDVLYEGKGTSKTPTVSLKNESKRRGKTRTREENPENERELDDGTSAAERGDKIPNMEKHINKTPPMESENVSASLKLMKLPSKKVSKKNKALPDNNSLSAFNDIPIYDQKVQTLKWLGFTNDVLIKNSVLKNFIIDKSYLNDLIISDSIRSIPNLDEFMKDMFNPEAWKSLKKLIREKKKTIWLCPSCSSDINLKASIMCNKCLLWCHEECCSMKKSKKKQSWIYSFPVPSQLKD